MVYDLGHDTEGVEMENWVIRWMLWHVFRYRDNRNKHRQNGNSSNGGTSERSSDQNSPGPRSYYDPVRDT